MKLSLAALLSTTAIATAAARAHVSRCTQNDTLGLLSLHEGLVSIPSLTGNESAVTTYLASYLSSHNFTVELQQVADGRNNIYAYTGSSRDARALLTSHMDTVGPYIPYGITANGTITGRGSNDAKGSIAAQVVALQQLLADGSVDDGDVAMLFVVGEEVDGAGMKAANDLGLSWEAVVFGEPTELKLAVGHKGALAVKLEAFGKAAHSGYPQLGVDANKALVTALYGLDGVELPGSALLGNSTLNYGLVRGGAAANVVSPYANASIAVRLAVDAETIKGQLDGYFGGVSGVSWSYLGFFYDPVVLDSDVEGFEKAVMSYGTDIPHLKGDHKKYLYGPGSITTAHSDHEFVMVSDLEEAVEGYKKLVLHALN
ncbi:uncharacterized protein LAJ45_08608 [Morchella importuna]|uniref:Zn-dependent exopeptidase n=1 Tax=Morchella conica CCBAS932 TaxID=1392247 RepID=A0A3N4KKS1_9PEZI|nr:uncharacterized protein LAJ45_08608 [Morchella importuna]KAH8147452.1 hypothetical protein LAJ45_08608 [Morchella importuna]RPB11156.1 Zn-dependent exopeptidase [Morchella conica CCBAS932]